MKEFHLPLAENNLNRNDRDNDIRARDAETRDAYAVEYDAKVSELRQKNGDDYILLLMDQIEIHHSHDLEQAKPLADAIFNDPESMRAWKNQYELRQEQKDNLAVQLKDLEKNKGAEYVSYVKKVLGKKVSYMELSNAIREVDRVLSSDPSTLANWRRDRGDIN